ncbi:hypothetical protein LTR10_010251 [Elasticomyces elasticus]|nr:hypothetical protein LTR10_010251 [Elasticomyces elasticus]KAK4972156.1 hypothetical protein LTR42_006662 [Elasticomyces elasticus]
MAFTDTNSKRSASPVSDVRRIRPKLTDNTTGIDIAHSSDSLVDTSRECEERSTGYTDTNANCSHVTADKASGEDGAAYDSDRSQTVVSERDDRDTESRTSDAGDDEDEGDHEGESEDEENHDYGVDCEGPEMEYGMLEPKQDDYWEDLATTGVIPDYMVDFGSGDELSTTSLLLTANNEERLPGSPEQQRHVVATAIAVANPDLPPPEVTLHRSKRWLVVFPTMEYASIALTRPVKLYGAITRLVPYSGSRSKIFVCDHLPGGLDEILVIAGILKAFPRSPVEAVRAYMTPDADNMIIILRACDENYAGIRASAQLRNGTSWSAHFRILPNAPICYGCGEDHPFSKDCWSWKSIIMTSFVRSLLREHPDFAPGRLLLVETKKSLRTPGADHAREVEAAVMAANPGISAPQVTPFSLNKHSKHWILTFSSLRAATAVQLGPRITLWGKHQRLTLCNARGKARKRRKTKNKDPEKKAEQERKRAHETEARLDAHLDASPQCVLLTEINSMRGGTQRSEVVQAVIAANPGVPAPNVEKRGKKFWLLTFWDADEAASALQNSISIQGKHSKLSTKVPK